VAYNAELQMLREFWYLHAPRTYCVFCKRPLAVQHPLMTFGHRRHPKVKAEFSVHHLDRQRSNNNFGNLADAHRGCHERHHAAERAARTGS
jgi:hypothetical protein